jgi:hypothetical protein
MGAIQQLLAAYGGTGAPAWDSATVSSPQSLSVSNKRLTQAISNAAISKTVRASRPIASGKWYWEILVGDIVPLGGDSSGVGIVPSTFPFATNGLSTNAGDASLWTSGKAYKSTSNVSTPTAAWVATDVILIAFDAGVGDVWFGRNGTFVGNPAAGTTPSVTGMTTGVAYYPAATCWTSNATHQVVLDIQGNSNLTYSPPSGFTAYSN